VDIRQSGEWRGWRFLPLDRIAISDFTQEQPASDCPTTITGSGPAILRLVDRVEAFFVFPGDLRMKKVCVCLVLACGMVACCLSNARALPPFNKEWVAKYNNGDKVAAFTEAKCNVCHAGESKKMKNAYGKVVGKYLTKAKYNEIKEDPSAAQKYILDGLLKAEAEKAANGQTYGDLLKAGKLPAAE
jgi:hypothetical protein